MVPPDLNPTFFFLFLEDLKDSCIIQSLHFAEGL